MILKGYIFSRPFFNERVPQHVQNIVIKDYCNKNNYKLLLSSTEYRHKDSNLILMNLIDNLPKFDGLVFYSFWQLPTNEIVRKKIYKKIFKLKKTLHFSVENLVLKNNSQIPSIEEMYKIKLSQLDYGKSYKLGKLKNFVNFRHKKVLRNYLQRINDEKIKCMKVSKKYSFDYWDGNRRFGYGGYKYIPNYHTYLAKKLIKTYSLNNKSKIIDIGCGKGFLIYEIKKILKNIQIYGTDISNYAMQNSKKEVKKFIKYHDVKKKFKYKDNFFDLAISINVLHNLKINEISKSLSEIERISKNKFICIESFRNEKEQFNLQCWALTAETLIDVEAWKWLFKKSKYSGDYEFIYFK